MKIALRIVLAAVSVLIGLRVAGWAAIPFIYQVRPGFKEGTPVTLVVFELAFALTTAAVFVIGNFFISRHFRKTVKLSKSDAAE